jgi:HK97 family phage major capsid protein
MTLEQVTDEIKSITPVLKNAFAEAGENLDASAIRVFGEGLDERQKSERLANMNVRLQELAQRKGELEASAKGRDLASEMDSWLSQPVGQVPAMTDAKGYQTLADLAAKDRGWMQGRPQVIDLDGKSWIDREVKTVMSSGAGFAPQAIRSGVVVPAAFQSPTVVDLIPTLTTTQNAFVFMRQTTRTNNAAEAAESVDGTLTSLAESAFAYSQISEPVRKLGHFIPVTDEQMEDVEGIDQILRQDMLTGVRQRLSSQILNGNGTAPNLTGFLDDGHTPTDVNASGLFFADAIDKLIEAVRTSGFTEPTAVIVHPSDWHAYRRATTTDGIYIAGHPSENVAPVIWGLPVVLTTEIAQGSAHCGNYQDYARLVMKRGIELSVSTEHASYFIQGVRAVKAEMRAAFAVLREAAFAKTNDI